MEINGLQRLARGIPALRLEYWMQQGKAASFLSERLLNKEAGSVDKVLHQLSDSLGQVRSKYSSMLLSNAFQGGLISRKQVKYVAHGTTSRVMTGEEELLDLAYSKCPKGGVHRSPGVIFREIGLQRQTNNGLARRGAMISKYGYLTVEFRVKVVVYLTSGIPMDEPA